MKTLKIYLKNCPGSSNTKIYCIKHDIGENLENLKEKINLRVPQLRFAAIEPIIYWYDLENDKIRITCDDDLKFFMEESEIRKLTFEFKIQQDVTRKRRLNSTQLVDYDVDDDVHSECSKRLRKIDLCSDSSMDTDSEEGDGKQVQQPSTSQVDNAPAKVNIISVETIQADIVNNNVKDNQVVVVVEAEAAVGVGENSNNTTDSGNETSNEEQQTKVERRSSESSNRIVISDSSEDEEDFNGNENRYNASNNNNSYYSYSFANAGVHGARMRPNENVRNFFNNTMRESQRRVYREQAFFRENIRAAHEQARDNIRAAHENAREGMRMARAQVENARRNVQSQMLQNFRAHFQPLFYSSYHGTYRR